MTAKPYQYVNEPDDDLKCVICLDVVQDPLQHEQCGKLFCKECIERLGKDKPCPHCRTQGSQYYPDHKSEYVCVEIFLLCDNVLERGQFRTNCN